MGEEVSISSGIIKENRGLFGEGRKEILACFRRGNKANNVAFWGFKKYELAEGGERREGIIKKEEKDHTRIDCMAPITRYSTKL